MGSIVIALLIIVLSVFLSNRSKTSLGQFWLAISGGFLAAPFLIFALFCYSGYFAPMEEARTIELYSLSGQKNPAEYVTINSKNEYTYYIQINSDFIKDDNSEAFVSISIPRNQDVQVIYEDNCELPRLVVYSQKPLPSFWSLALANDKITNVFYVPRGSVSNQTSFE